MKKPGATRFAFVAPLNAVLEPTPGTCGRFATLYRCSIIPGVSRPARKKSLNWMLLSLAFAYLGLRNDVVRTFRAWW